MGFGMPFYPRPQDSESTASRLICAVNQSAAQLVPRWGTTRESWVLWFYCFLFFLAKISKSWRSVSKQSVIVLGELVTRLGWVCDWLGIRWFIQGWSVRIWLVQGWSVTLIWLVSQLRSVGRYVGQLSQLVSYVGQQGQLVRWVRLVGQLSQVGKVSCQSVS